MDLTDRLAYIETPPATGKPVKSLNDFLTASGSWHEKTERPNRGILSDIWYRGVSKHFPHQAPGVYRNEFSERAKHLQVGSQIKRLFLERYMLSQFRTAVESNASTRYLFPVEIALQ
jgi:hypothetical protein